MSVLIDTAVLAETMKPESEGSRWARRWLTREPLSVSAISVFELAFGFQQASWQAVARSDDLQAGPWLYARTPTPPSSWQRVRGRSKTRTNVKGFQELARLLPPEWALSVLRFPQQAPEHL